MSECKHDDLDTPYCPICGECVESDHIAELRKMRRKYVAFIGGKCTELARVRHQLSLPVAKRRYNHKDERLQRDEDTTIRSIDTAGRKVDALDAAIQAMTK